LRKICFFSILIAVRDTCVDWFNGNNEAGSIEEALALGLKLSKKDHNEINHIKFNKRCVGPSSTQVNYFFLIKEKRRIIGVFLALYGSNDD
jgi:hypothetical protein